MAAGGRIPAVYVDTGAFFAAVHADDFHHADAVDVLKRVREKGVPLFTSKWVVAETHALLLARCGRGPALQWVERVPAVALPVSEEDEEEALRILRVHTDKDFTLVDASSFAMMERLGIRHYHSYDRHFRQYGRFIAVTPRML